MEISHMTRRGLINWLIAFLGFPLGGLAATLLLGQVDTELEGLLGGLIAGGVIGTVQLWALRPLLSIDWRWIVATAAGLGAGVGLSVLIVGGETTQDAFLMRAPITGLVLSIAQWWLLKDHLQRAFWWIPALIIIYTLAWFVTAQVIGTSLEMGFVVFGASGALVYQVFTGGLLWRLLQAKRSVALP
jgi:hypothetical protein